MAASGDVVVVGARGHDERGLQAGAVYVFRFGGVAWSEEAELLASDATAGSVLGQAVSVDGDTIAAGAPRAFGLDVSAVYVYRDDGAGWTEEAKLETGPGAISGGFGHAVAISGGIVAAGAPHGGTGSVYVFRRDAGGWSQKPPRVSSDGSWYDGLGSGVALSGRRILAGASGHDTLATDSGAAYVFDLPAGPIPVSAPFVPIPGLPGERDSSSARAISADGSTLVGVSDRTLQGHPLFEAFRWTRRGGTELLPAPQGFDTLREALDVSAQGLTVVRRGDGTRGERALLWPAGGGSEWILASTRMVARAVSADGTVVVGYSRSANTPPSEFESFRWTEAQGMVGLGALPGGDGASRAQDVSPGGEFVVGASSTPAAKPEAYRWSEAEAMIGLCDPPACMRGSASSEAYGVSDDGAVVVGRLTRLDAEYPFNTQAFYWTAGGGMRRMADVIEQDFGVDLTDWILVGAAGISADGHAIAGNAIDADGNVRAWVMYTRLPVDLLIEPFRDPNLVDFAARRPLPVAVLGSQSFDVARVDPASLAFGPAGASPLREKSRDPQDVNGDGWTDLVSHYDVGETGIAVGDTQACLGGRTLDGLAFAGCEAVRTTPVCGLGAELVLLVPPLARLRRRRASPARPASAHAGGVSPPPAGRP